MEATVIYDAISWSEEIGKLPDGRPNMLVHTATRGQTVDLPQEEYDRLADPKTHAPFGAVAEVGSDLASRLSQPISGAEDPAAVRARLAAIQTDGPSVAPMLDPSGRHALAPATEVSPDVLRSQAAPASASATGAAAGLPDAALQALDKAGLTKMAKALGVETDSKDSKDAIIAKMQAHLAGAASATGETDSHFASGGSAAFDGLDDEQLKAKAEELGLESKDGESREDLMARVSEAHAKANES